jgi:hypothetical protein
MKVTPSFLAVVASVFIVAGFGIAHFLTEVVAYPLDEWRMDLDDLLANAGLFLAGLAAWITVRQRAKAAEQKAEAVDDKINGGIRKLAADMIRDEMEVAGVNRTTVEMEGRVESLEAERNQCRSELATMRATLRQMGGD